MPLKRWDTTAILKALAIWEEQRGRLPKSSEWQKKSADGEPLHPTARTVALTFGSWAQAISTYQNNGSSPKQRHEQWRPDEILDALRRYEVEFGKPPAGRDLERVVPGYPTVTTIRRYFGTINNALELAGLPSRPQGLTRKAIDRFKPLPKKGS